MHSAADGARLTRKMRRSHELRIDHSVALSVNANHTRLAIWFKCMWRNGILMAASALVWCAKSILLPFQFVNRIVRLSAIFEIILIWLSRRIRLDHWVVQSWKAFEELSKHSMRHWDNRNSSVVDQLNRNSIETPKLTPHSASVIQCGRCIELSFAIKLASLNW